MCLLVLAMITCVEIRGEPQVLSKASILSEIGSLVHLSIQQANWLVSLKDSSVSTPILM